MLSSRCPTWARLWPVAVVSCSIFVTFSAPLPRAAAEDGPETEWTYRRLRRPDIPAVRGKAWVENPVDAFILASLEKAGLQPNARADRLTLLRRVTYDLTGLAPTEAEREAFLNDPAPDAYEKLVERLLGSSHFGERWAQHWLDVVRYSETEGFKIDRLREHAYRYRDYVIHAINTDVPYDQFVQQQLAGDELDPDHADALVATGFLRLHAEESNGSNYRQIRQEILDDITDVVGMTFLGLTVGCARCHDHKFDPIGQDDYYRLQAFFAPLMQRDDVPLVPKRDCKQYEQKLNTWLGKTQQVRGQMEGMLKPIGEAVFKEIADTLDPETQHALTMRADERDPLQTQLAVLGGKQIERRMLRRHLRLTPEQRVRYDALKKQMEAYNEARPSELPVAMAACDVGPVAPPTYRLAGGDYKRPKEQVEPGFPECLDKREPEIKPPPGRPNSTGRRAALARWLTQPDHPLTGRVMVNRLWAHYFGKGIVGTPNDFGKMGQAPTHPELLDYLASELVQQGWSLKAIHRLIVTSAAYRQSSAPEANPTSAVAQKVDPDDKLLWHTRVRRRDGESIRDAALQASSQLNPRMYGPSAAPELPKPLMEDRYAWYADEHVSDQNRRSVYVFNRRNLALPLFQAFDAPDRNGSCPARAVTVSAPQALLMLNGEFTLTQARHLAGLLLSRSTDMDEIVRQAYRRVLNRTPDGQDLSRARLFLEQQAQRIASTAAPTAATLPEPLPQRGAAAPAAALVDFCHALINSAEFLYVD